MSHLARLVTDNPSATVQVILVSGEQKLEHRCTARALKKMKERRAGGWRVADWRVLPSIDKEALNPLPIGVLPKNAGLSGKDQRRIAWEKKRARRKRRDIPQY